MFDQLNHQAATAYGPVNERELVTRVVQFDDDDDDEENPTIVRPFSPSFPHFSCPLLLDFQ
jgi:hypothetical protein